MKKNLFILSFLFLGLGLIAQTPRLSLYEEFTGETCPPCASTNPGLNLLLSSPTNTPKIVAIKWQVPIPSAPTKTWSLYQTNKTEIDWRWKATGYGYNPAINSAPSSKIDGQEATVFGASSGHPANLTSAVIATAQSYTSAFSISMNRAWNKTCTAVTLTINITATAPFTSVGSLIFRTVMVEHLIQFSVQPGTNGETKFEDAVIKSFPTLQQGVAMASSWTVGQTQTFTLNCPLPSYTRKKEEVAFVGFIQDDGNRKVAQAMRLDQVAIPQDALSGVAAHVDLTCSNVVTPTVEVKNEGSVNPITNLTLTPYIDGVAGTPFAWTGNLAPGATAIIPLGSVNSPAMAGSHSFSCDIDMPSPVYNLISNTTKVNYMVGGNYQAIQVAEGFSGTAYPPAGFGVVNPNNGPGWSRSTITGGYNLNSESTKYDFFNNTVVGDQDELYLPPMDLSNSSDATLSFDLAYAQRDENSDDGLQVMVSDNCGATWTSKYNKHGFTLATASTNLYTYVPDSQNPAEWRTEQLDMSDFNKPNVLVKFVTTSDNGNNLYLDNINLAFGITGLNHTSASALKVSLFPNPTNGTAKLNMDKMQAGAAKITVTNTLGQVVLVKNITLTEGSTTLELDMKEYAAGVYNVAIDSKSGSVVKKLTLTK